MKKQTFIYKNHATLCSMEEILQEVQEKEKIQEICRVYGLNLDLLQDFFKLKARGLNNQSTAEKLGVHRVTLQRYSRALKSMKESEFNYLYTYILRGKENDGKT